MPNPSFDSPERGTSSERDAAHMAALRALVAHAKENSPAHAMRLAQMRPESLDSRAALAQLPILRKSELLEQQRQSRGTDPFAGFSACGWTGLGRARATKRVFQSPGPLYEPQGFAPDAWRMARALQAAGFCRGDLVHISFSFHLTPAGAMMEEGALALGCTVFPGGVGNTELQLRAMLDLAPQGYAGTPSFLRILIEQAESQQFPLHFLRKALVSGEPFPPSLQRWLQERGVEAYQCYATADVGLIAYETADRHGLVVDQDIFLEIVDPVTGAPVPEGAIGELVVTTFDLDYPLIRFATGDLSAMLPRDVASLDAPPRIRGWMGRTDQATKVRGMFVHPMHVEEVIRRHPTVLRARLVIEGAMAADRVTLRAEAPHGSTDLAVQIGETLRNITKLRVDVQLLAPGELGDGGKAIEDLRSFD